jgi:hypothetical protein
VTPELANNLKVKAELVEVSRAFAARGIEHVVLKGVPLVVRLYQRLDARWIGDNDLLIRTGDEARSIEVLTALGYRTKRDPEVGLLCNGRATFRRGDPSSQVGEAIVDLHVAAFDPLLFSIPEQLVWQHAESFDAGQLNVRVLDQELTLLHLAAHCAQHAMMEPRILRDFARAWNDWGALVNLAQVEQLAHQYGLLESFMFALWVAEDLGMLRRSPPQWRAPRARLLRQLLTTRRLLRPTDQMPYLRMAAMGTLLSAPQLRHFLRSYLFPPAAKLPASTSNVPLWGRYALRLVQPLMRRATNRAGASPH